MADSDPDIPIPSQLALASTPHDALFRMTFTQVEHARGELQHLLPASVVAGLDWSTLRVESGAYVEPDLRTHYSDILFSVKRKQDRTAVYIYVLVEHLSTPERLIALRMLRYLVAAQHDHLKNGGTGSGTPPMPPVVLPVLVSNGERNWPHPLDLHSLFQEQLEQFPELVPHVPQMTVFIDDLPATSVLQLAARELTDLAVLTLCFLRDGRNLKRFRAGISHWIQRLRRLLSDNAADFPTLLQYLLRVTPPMHHAELCATITSEAPDMEAPITNAYDWLVASGKAEGEAKGKAELVLKLLTLKFSALPSGIAERVNSASAEQLDELAGRILSAETLEEVFTER